MESRVRVESGCFVLKKCGGCAEWSRCSLPNLPPEPPVKAPVNAKSRRPGGIVAEKSFGCGVSVCPFVARFDAGFPLGTSANASVEPEAVNNEDG